MFDASESTAPLQDLANPVISPEPTEAYGLQSDLLGSATSEAPLMEMDIQNSNFAQNWNLDIDGDGEINSLSDGIMVVRYLFGSVFAGDALTNGAIGSNATRTTSEIWNYLDQGLNLGAFDLDGDGTVAALSDGIMMVRYLFGSVFAGDALTDGAISANATRTAEQIRSHCDTIVTLDSSLSPYISINSIEQSLEPGKTYTIRWSDNIDENVVIELFDYSDSSLVTTIISDTESDGSFSWTVPWNLTANVDYQIKIKSIDDSNIKRYSTLFSVPRSISTSAFSENDIVKGSTETIRWLDNIEDNVKILLFEKDTGKYVTTITDNTVSNGQFQWHVPLNLNNNIDYQLKIISLANDIFSYNNSFRPVDGYISIDSVTGGSITPGTTKRITWSDNITNNVVIELFDASSATLIRTIASNTESDGVLDWQVPKDLPTNGDYQIKISSIRESSIRGYSTLFSVPKYLEINPFSDGKIGQGDTERITWSDNVNDNFQILLFKTGGIYVDEIFSSTASDGSESWTVPNSLVIGEAYQLKFVSTQDTSFFKYSPIFTISQGTNIWEKPLNSYTVTSEFGERTYWNGTKWVTDNHTGIDLATSHGTTVESALAGTVLKVWYDSIGGNQVKIEHPNGLVTWYAHLSSVNVFQGQQVTNDTVIGAVGSTGNSTGPHLHFQVNLNGTPVNPRNYIRF